MLIRGTTAPAGPLMLKLTYTEDGVEIARHAVPGASWDEALTQLQPWVADGLVQARLQQKPLYGELEDDRFSLRQRSSGWGPQPLLLGGPRPHGLLVRAVWSWGSIGLFLFLPLAVGLFLLGWRLALPVWLVYAFFLRARLHKTATGGFGALTTLFQLAPDGEGQTSPGRSS